jgi:hypothetical protein
MVLGADHEAVVVGPLGVFLVPFDDVIELLVGPRLTAPAGIQTHELRPEDFGGLEICQGVLIILLALGGVAFPDMHVVRAQIGQHQFPLVEGFPDLLQVTLLHAGQKAVPDIGDTEVVAVLAGFQVSEHIHLALLQQSSK